MKLTLKIVIALAVITTAAIAYAEVPDVTKWNCPNGVIERDPDYDAEFMFCDGSSSGSFYLKISGELVFIYKHQKDNGKTVYYNALKANKGNWVEMINERSFTRNIEVVNNGLMIGITDDNDKVIAKRFVSPFQK